MSYESYGNDLVMLDGDFVLTDAGDLMTAKDYESGVTPPFDGYYNIMFSIFNRLNTAKGEIPWEPDYGTSLPMLVSKPNSKAMAELIKDEFYEAIRQDPRVVDVKSFSTEQNGNKLSVKAELLLSGKAESSVFIFPNFFIE